MSRPPTHGQASVSGHTPEYRAWISMKSRCNNTSNAGYPEYGGRGIKICRRWRRFENFYEDMGKRPSPQHSLDRIDNDGNYSPDNCRWATKLEQALNTRRAKVAFYKGKVRSLTEIAAMTGVSYKALYHRLVDMDWSVKDAVTKPIRFYPPRRH